MSDRHTLRVQWHDYNSGIYFVTICSYEKRHIFGRIVDGTMILSDFGKIVERCIANISNHSESTEVWNFVVMPNHIHIILYVGAQYIAPTPTNTYISAPNIIVDTGSLKPPRHGEPCANNHFNSKLAIIIRTFKAAVTREINKLLLTARAQCIAPLHDDKNSSIRVWQRNFHEHIIRNQLSFDNIMNYIDCNIERWESDCFNQH